ncbi:unnamed protein product [Heterobilharzia americana]|nr:unnamed protein product [Heterobilharzia americana]
MNNSAVDTNYHLFYGFNDPEGQSIALTAISVVKPILNRKELFLFDKTSRTTGYSGMVSARQLHFICGPYPELHIENNILFDKVVQTGIMPVLLMMLIVLSSLTFAVLTRSTMQTPVYAVLLGITIAEMSNGLLPLPMYLLRAFYDGYTHNTEHRQNTNEDEIKSKINCFCCITTSKLHAFLFTNQNHGNFHTNLHKNISLDAIDNNDDNQIQNKGFNVAAVRRKSQVTELFCVSNMLIVLLIKFILIHLPIALVIFIYTIKLMQNRIYGRPTSTHSNGVVQEFIPIIRSSNHTILLPYTVMELVSELDRVNAAINVSEAHTNIIWLRVVTICNLLILCSYLLNFLVFWTMSTQFRTQFRNLFQCRWIKRLCSKK